MATAIGIVQRQTTNKHRTASKGVAQRPREIDYYDSLINSSSSTTNNSKERTPCLSPEQIDQLD